MIKKILSIDEYIEKMKSEQSSNSADLDKPKTETKPLSEEKKPNLPDLKVGDFVEDKYGNRYEVSEITKDFKVADDFDDWEQVSKYKDKEDITFVIVWAKEEKEKKFVFVYGVEDDYAVRKVDAPELNSDDKLTKTFKAVCDFIKDDVELQKFKNKWRKFMDLVRAGKIPNEKYIMMEILDDFNATSVVDEVTKPKVQESLLESSAALGDSLPNGIYDVKYKNEVYYIHPKVGDTKMFAYRDKDLQNVIKLDGKTLMFTVKELFGVEKWQKEWTEYSNEE